MLADGASFRNWRCFGFVDNLREMVGLHSLRWIYQVSDARRIGAPVHGRSENRQLQTRGGRPVAEYFAKGPEGLAKYSRHTKLLPGLDLRHRNVSTSPTVRVGKVLLATPTIVCWHLQTDLPEPGPRRHSPRAGGPQEGQEQATA